MQIARKNSVALAGSQAELRGRQIGTSMPAGKRKRFPGIGIRANLPFPLQTR